MVEFPALEQFVGGYFHQDWRLDYADEQEALADFVDGQAELVPQLSNELKTLLSRDLTDEELVEILVAHGAEHVPTGSDGTTRGWLQGVHRTLVPDAADRE